MVSYPTIAAVPSVSGTLCTLALARADRAPEREFYRFAESGQSFSSAELVLRAQALAVRLQFAGARGKPVLLLVDAGADYTLSLYACWFAGALPIPAYPPHPSRPDERIAAIVRVSEAKHALVAKSHAPRIADLGLQGVFVDELDLHDAHSYRAPSKPYDFALVQYTSGSTASPRGVLLRHRHFIANAEGVAAAVEAQRGRPADQNDRVVSWLPPWHDMGLMLGVVVPLVFDVPATLMTPAMFVQSPLSWLSVMSSDRGTISGGPNFGYELCTRRVPEAALDALDLSRWDVAYSGSERVRPATMARFDERFQRAGFRKAAWAPAYGLAEATLAVTIGGSPQGPRVLELDADQLTRGVVAPVAEGGRGVAHVGCGRPLPDVSIQIVDRSTKQPLPEGRVGEIWMRGPSVADGYTGDERASEATFGARLSSADPLQSAVLCYLRTGDLGFLSDGELFITGRVKDILKLGGVLLHPEDIEGAVVDVHPSLRPLSCAAFGTEHAGEERLVLVQELQRAVEPDDAAAAIDAMVTAVGERLALAVHDVVLIAPGGLPKTSSGKLRRADTRALYESNQLKVVARLRDADRLAPEQDALVQRICTLMSEVLRDGVRVEPDDDFFALGAHSLLATQLLSRLRDGLGLDLNLRDVFAASSARALAAIARERPALAPLPLPTRIDRTGELPLSFSQERMWFMHQLDPNSAAYNVAGAMSAEGPLDRAAFVRAVQSVMARHELMRATFPTRDGRPTTQVAPHVTLEVPYVDLSKEASPERSARQRAAMLAARPFDVAREVLVRVELYRLADKRHVMAVSMHHIISDAWSMGVLASEMTRAYTDVLAGREPDARPEPYGYIDYAAWQRSEYARRGIDAEFSYWKERLQGVEPLVLPTDRPRTQRRSSRGAFEPLALDPALLTQVRKLAQETGTTPFMVLLAAFSALLARYTRSDDFVVGVPVANRNRLAAEPLIGTLVNTLAIRLRPTRQLSFRELIAHVRETSLDAFAHQDLPFERLVAELGVERRAGESPLVQVMFDYQNAPTEGPRMGDMTLKPLAISRGAAQFDLSLLVLDTDLGWLAGAEFATDLFDVSTVRRLLGHFATLLAAGVADPARAVGTLPMLGDDEREALMQVANRTFSAPPVDWDLPSRIAEHAARTPNAVALRDEHGALDYGALLQRARSVAERLVAAGVTPGDRVAVLTERSCELVVALLGVLLAGGAYVPLDPAQPALRSEAVLEDAAPRCALVSRALVGHLRWPEELRIVPVDAPALAAPPALPAADLSRPAYVLYTSGSTGKPKGVVVPCGALANFLRSMAHTPGLTRDDRVLAVTTITFDIAGLELFLPLSVGASVVIAPSAAVADGGRLIALFEAARPTLFQATPALYRLLLAAGWRGSASLTALCGGEQLPRDLADALLPRVGALWNVYGPTETTIWSTLARVQPGSDAVSIGEPIDRTRVYVLDAEGAPTPLGVPGELYIGGDGVALGYHGRPDLTAERFLRDPFSDEAGARMYRTGDLARIRADGTLECLGRLDAQIKLRGYRIEPAEIEAVLKASGLVQDVVVVAHAFAADDVRLIAYYVANTACDELALRDVVARALPAYMVPAHFEALTTIPLTPSGKVDRKALRAPSAERRVSRFPEVAPRDELERAIAAVWSEVLNVAEPSIHADFFSLGGHSLLAVRVIAGIERTLGVTLPLQVLLAAPTIAGLAEALRARREPEANAPSAREAPPLQHIVPLREGEGAPLFWVHGAGGNVFNLLPTARALPLGQAVYGLQARGADGVGQPHASVEEMAAQYLGELRRVAPRGPYRLLGYCAGGIVALAMARMLEAQGETVAFVGLVDTYAPGSSPATEKLAWLNAGALRSDPRSFAARARNSLARRWQALSTRATITLHRALGRPVPLEVREIWLTLAFLAASRSHAPRPCRAPITVFRARDVAGSLLALPAAGWQTLGFDVKVVDVPGGHHSLLLTPNAEQLAAAVAQALAAHESPELP